MGDNVYKIDLHTHSIISHDGGITALQYEKILKSSQLDYIAITDHNDISFALTLHKKLGEKIIIGQEIMTIEGEIIGLFLEEKIQSGLTLDKAIEHIKKQSGLVYIPHPFEKFRHGIISENLNRIAQEIDIIETFNGRGRFRSRTFASIQFAKNNNKAQASSSDAHGYKGMGTALSIISEIPNQKNLVRLLHSATYKKSYAPFVTFFYPTVNRVKHKVKIK